MSILKRFCLDVSRGHCPSVGIMLSLAKRCLQLTKLPHKDTLEICHLVSMNTARKTIVNEKMLKEDLVEKVCAYLIKWSVFTSKWSKKSMQPIPMVSDNEIITRGSASDRYFHSLHLRSSTTISFTYVSVQNKRCLNSDVVRSRHWWPVPLSS